MSYENTGTLNFGTNNGSPETARASGGRWRRGLFFVVWTVLASLAVWWLVRRAGAANASPNWVIEADPLANIPLAERIGNWFKLADLNFRGIYPLVLLAPYVAWLGTRFRLEHGLWRVSLPAHLAGCALFVVASHALEARIGWGHQIIVRFRTETATTQGGKEGAVETTGRTNEFVIVTNAPLAQVLGPLDGESVDKASGPGPASLSGPRGPGLRNALYRRQWDAPSLADLFSVFAYAAVVGLAHAVHFYRRSREREGRAAALEAQLTRARLNALQAQLHPHFLFNGLNAISTLLRRDTRAAQDALASLSELLRLALCHSMQPEVSLREDLEFLRRYVEIQQTRLGDRLRFEEVIAQDLLDNLVPALLLQPLVENAIRHGIEPSPDSGLVRVVVQAHREQLVVTVEDNGAGLPDKEDGRGAGIGIGLQNLRSRLESLYGGQQRIEFGPRAGGGVIVRVEIPLRQAQPAETAPIAP